MVCAQIFVFFFRKTACVQSMSVHVSFGHRHVSGSMAARREARLRRSSERVLRSRRPLSDPVCVHRGRHQRDRGAGRRRKRGRRHAAIPRPAHRGVARWIRASVENHSTRPRFAVDVFQSTHGARQARKTESAQNHRLGTCTTPPSLVATLVAFIVFCQRGVSGNSLHSGLRFPQ